jgi:hypothetical protein
VFLDSSFCVCVCYGGVVLAASHKYYLCFAFFNCFFFSLCVCLYSLGSSFYTCILCFLFSFYLCFLVYLFPFLFVFVFIFFVCLFCSFMSLFLCLGIKYNISNGGPAPESLTEKIYQKTLSIKSYKIANIVRKKHTQTQTQIA